jgi:hypothetical protein
MTEDQDKLQPINEDNFEVPEEEEYYEPRTTTQVINYLQTKRGDEALSKILKTLDSISPAVKKYLEAKADGLKADAIVKEKNPEIEYKKWRALLIIRAIVILISLGAAVYLQITGNLNSTTALLIGTIITILATYDRKQQSN